MSIFKPCDVRGIVGDEWDVDDARRIGQSLGQMLQRRRQSRIVVGGDFRRSTPLIKEALVAGLRGLGIDILDVGHAATPIVHFAARQLDCPNLAVVTASHNPGKYNGIKFLVNAAPPVPSLMTELQSGLELPCPEVASGHVSSYSPLDDYQSWVITRSQTLVAEQRAKCGLAGSRPGSTERLAASRVVIDAMGGAFTHVAAHVLKTAGYDTTSVDDRLDPDFTTRDPNPAIDANMQSLVETVLREQADIGVALDGDGDRVVFVDHLGEIVHPEHIAALLVQECFPGSTVVYDLKCASIVPRAVLSTGGRVIMQPSGHGFIKTEMMATQADLGVEVSGHHFFGAIGGGDDGLFTTLVLLKLVGDAGRTLAEMRQHIGWPVITPDLRLPFAGSAVSVLETIAASCGGQVTRIDGVRAAYEADGWALARTSITEPAITFRFEGRDRERLLAIIDRFLANVPELRKQVLEKIP
jgi:phosphomannomutase/phosphoglucomutase